MYTGEEQDKIRFICLYYSMQCFAQGALAVETEPRGFQIPCEMQRGSDLLRPDYTKERSKRDRGHSFGVWCHRATRNGVRVYRDGLLQTCAHSTL